LESIKRKKKSHREALLALSLVPQLGGQRIGMLLNKADHPAEILMMPRPELLAVDGIGPAIADAILEFDDWEKVDQLLEQSRRIDAQIISCYDEQYPDLLREIYDPPLLLWVKGSTDVLQSSGIAVIGTRRATHYGLSQAGELSRLLVENGLTVVSGLAYGVDAAAHKATLQAGGKTIAVLGSGIDNIYPSKNAGIARDIIKNEGAVITEFPPGTAPDAGNFPVRNRIVSGMTMGTLVIESGLKGGSMITAQSALTQNREVFVVPHSLENVNGIGCNHLIKRGAGKLVQTVNDILEELPQYEVQEVEKAGNAKAKPHWKSQDLDDVSSTICEMLEDNPMHIDDLSAEMDVSSHQLLAKLLELEMDGCVRQRAGKIFELV
jgi:DNA processing protein